MVLINFTNIVVDDFSAAKRKPFSTYIHFLTHMHTDHFNGLSDSWDLGAIHCSSITANLLRQRFPKITNIIVLDLERKYTIYLNKERDIHVNVTLFDANHCAGAVMILFEGYMGTILHTGDIRFNKQKFGEYYQLYPHNLRTPNFEGCSVPIDYLYIDNTFCDPVFDFPLRDDALKEIEQYVAKQQNKRILVGLDHLGKEQILEHLATKFNTLIVVDEIRYKNIIHCEFNYQLFTTETNQGWIEIVPKRSLYKRLCEDESTVGIIPTGWCNKSYLQMNNRLLHVPYSLHSNFKELTQFVKSIKPAFIEPIVRTASKKDQYQKEFDKIKQTLPNLYAMASYQQTGFLQLKKYSGPVSESYQKFMSDDVLQTAINRKLTLIQTEQQINSYYLGMTTRPAKKTHRIGAKITVQRNQQEIQQLKKQIQNYATRPEPQIINLQSQNNSKDKQLYQLIEDSPQPIIQCTQRQVPDQSQRRNQREKKTTNIPRLVKTHERIEGPFKLPDMHILKQQQMKFMEFFTKNRGKIQQILQSYLQ